MSCSLRIFAFLLSFVASAAFANDATVVVNTQTKKKVKKEDLKNIDNIVNIRLVEPHTINNSEFKMDILFKVGKHFALGPSIAYMNGANGIHAGGARYDLAFYTNRTNRTQLGARGIYYFNHVNMNSTYISTHARAATTEITSSFDINPAQATSKFNSTIAGATAGYQWSIGRIRAFVGGGFERHILPDTIDLNYNDGTQTAFVLKDENATALIIDGGIGVTF